MTSFSSNCDFFFFKLSNCFIKIVPLKLANACPPEAAAVHAVEEAKHRTKFASVLAFLHTFMTLDRRCFFCSTLLLIEMLMLLLAILKGSTSNREMWGSVCQGRHVTTNGEALVPVPFGTMFIRLCHTSKCNYLLQNMSLYMRESIGHEKKEWEERKNKMEEKVMIVGTRAPRDDYIEWSRSTNTYLGSLSWSRRFPCPFRPGADPEFSEDTRTMNYDPKLAVNIYIIFFIECRHCLPK